MTAPIYTFAVRDVATIRDAWLRVYKNALVRRGISSPNIAPGSDAFIEATAFANEATVVEANAVISVDAMMPDTAPLAGLLRWGDVVDQSVRGAAGSVGNIKFSTSQTTLVTALSQLRDNLGQLYEVTTGNTYANGDSIAIAAVGTGSLTNHAEGDTLEWVSAPPFSDSNALVGVGGLTGGTDVEDTETFRTRVIAQFATPPASGNWQYVTNVAEAAHPAVQKAFTHPALQGPGTVHVTVVGYAQTTGTLSATSKNRDLQSTIVNNVVAPTISGLMPEHVAITTTTVTNVATDVSVALALPASATASPPGPGGGWFDGTPWPFNSAASATFRCSVTAVAGTTLFTVDAPTLPAAGSRICWLSPVNWTLYRATVTSSSGSPGAVQIALSAPFPNIAIGHFISPDAVNMQAYMDAMLTAFAAMGPGEKTANSTVLQRAFRHPVPQQSWPYALGPQHLKALVQVGPEVLDAQFLYRQNTTPAIPGVVTDPPNILTPRNIGLYAQ